MSDVNYVWLRHRDAQAAAVACRVVGGGDGQELAAPVGDDAALEGAGRIRSQAGPATFTVVQVLGAEAQAVAGAEAGHGDGNHVVVLDLVEDRLPVALRHTRVRHRPRERDEVHLLVVRGEPAELQVVELERVAGGGRGGGGRAPLADFGRSAAGEKIVRGEAKSIGDTAALHGHHHVEVLPAHLDDLTILPASQEQGLPGLDGHGHAVAHDVNGAVLHRGDERAVAEGGRAQVVVALHESLPLGLLTEVVVGGGLDAPALQHRLPTLHGHELAVTLRIRGRTHQKPDGLVGESAVDGRDLGLGAQALVATVAIRLAVRDEGHIIEAEVAAREGRLGLERGQSPVLDHVHGGIVRRLDQAAVRVPLGRGQLRGVGVPTRERAHHVHGGQLHVFAPAGHVDGQTLEGLTVDAILRGIAGVPPEVDVIAEGVAGGALVAQELAGRNLALVVHEHRAQVRDDDVRAVTKVDVDVDAEPRGGVLVMHVGATTERHEHRDVLVVRGVEIHVIHGGTRAVRGAAVIALRAERLVAVLERQLRRDHVLATAREERRLERPVELTARPTATAHQTRAQHEHAEQERTKVMHFISQRD